jgi:hypothetical protein
MLDACKAEKVREEPMTTETVKRCPKCGGQVKLLGRKPLGLTFHADCERCKDVFTEAEFNALPEWGEKEVPTQ